MALLHQLAHLCSKADIPSALHHQQDLDLVLTFHMSGDSCEGGDRKGNKFVVVRTGVLRILPAGTLE